MSLTDIGLVNAAVCLGAVLQAVTGLGAGLIIVPFLALISTAFIPGPLVFASMSLSLTMLWFGRHFVDYRYVFSILAGVGVGAVTAAIFVAQLPVQKMSLIFGTVILAAVAFSLWAPKFRFNRQGGMFAGLVSGLAGTTSGIGAPFLALLYQYHQGPNLRATLALLYTISSVFILTSLYMVDRFGSVEAILGLYLMPGFLLGYFLSPKLTQRIDKHWARVAVLSVSTVSALALIFRSL